MGKPRNAENTRHTWKYPKYPEIPESKKDTWKYPIVFFDTPTWPEPDLLPLNFWPFLSKGRLHPWAKYSEPKKQIAKIFFLLGATGQWSWSKSGQNGEDPKGLNGFWQKMAPKFFLASPVTVLAVSQNPPTSRFWSFGFLIYTLLCVQIKKNSLWYIFLFQSIFLILVAQLANQELSAIDQVFSSIALLLTVRQATSLLCSWAKLMLRRSPGNIGVLFQLSTLFKLAKVCNYSKWVFNLSSFSCSKLQLKPFASDYTMVGKCFCIFQWSIDFRFWGCGNLQQ